MEIMGKFVSAMSGFWWALDEHERKVIVIGGVYLLTLILLGPAVRSRHEHEQEELVEAVVERLRRRGG